MRWFSPSRMENCLSCLHVSFTDTKFTLENDLDSVLSHNGGDPNGIPRLSQSRWPMGSPSICYGALECPLIVITLV